MKKVWKITIGVFSSLAVIFSLGFFFPNMDGEELGRIIGGEILPAVIGLSLGYYCLRKYREKKAKKKELENERTI